MLHIDRRSCENLLERIARIGNDVRNRSDRVCGESGQDYRLPERDRNFARQLYLKIPSATARRRYVYVGSGNDDIRGNPRRRKQ